VSRKRMIDPGIWTDEGFLELSALARLLFIGLISHADDHGKGVASVKSLKAKVFPGDDLTDAKVTGLKEEIKQHTRTVFYKVDWTEYYQLARWPKYQTVNRPNESTIPDQDAVHDTMHDPFTDQSLIDHGALTTNGKEGKGKEGKGIHVHDQSLKEPKTERAKGVTLTDSEYADLSAKHGKPLVDEAIEYLSGYKEANGKTYKSDAGALRQWAIQAALERRDKARKAGTAPPRGPGRICAKCGYENHHTGGQCLRCREDLARGDGCPVQLSAKGEA